jgi:hypothetical protein
VSDLFYVGEAMSEHIQVGTGPCSGCDGPHKITDPAIIDEAARILIELERGMVPPGRSNTWQSH